MATLDEQLADVIRQRERPARCQDRGRRFRVALAHWAARWTR